MRGIAASSQYEASRAGPCNTRHVRGTGRIALAAVGLAAALAAPPASADAGRPALFKVGAASRSLDPPIAVYAGGFGPSPPIRRTHDPLATRAIYISNRRRAVALATADLQGWFAAYQEGPYGISSIRQEAAARISRLGGPKMAARDMIVQATHTHAGPTVEGIWGPVPLRYLKLVHDRTVDALVAAARGARDANLQWATVDAPYLDNINTAQTDSYAGWAQDGQLSVLRAVTPRTRRTIATFANVPAHGDIVNGAGLKTLSADYFGFARATLQKELGGVAIVGPATLGREESPIQTKGIANSRWYSCTVSDLVSRGLSRARWITSDTIRSTESLLEIPGTNAALLALVTAWHLPPARRQQLLDTGGIYPIDRSDRPPYLTGAVIGTPLTALRIGRFAYTSQPGEPFPEVRHTIAEATRGADAIAALSKGQDDLGYYYPTFVYPAAFVYNSDHHIYNIAPHAGDEVIQGQLANLGALGFDTHFQPAHPLPTRFEQGLKPGLQALASSATGDAGRDGRYRTTLQAIYDAAAFGGSPMKGKVHWDFGDGTTADTIAESFEAPAGPKGARFVHAYPGPGRYRVRLTAHSENGDVARWSLTVHAYPKVHLSFASKRVDRSTYRLTARVRGGQGSTLAYVWRFPGGGVAYGRTVTHRFAAGQRRAATLAVADGAGCGVVKRTRDVG